MVTKSPIDLASYIFTIVDTSNSLVKFHKKRFKNWYLAFWWSTVVDDNQWEYGLELGVILTGGAKF